MRIEKCRTGKVTVNRMFEKCFTEKYLQDVGLTLDFDLGALMRRYHRDASDRSDTRMWLRAPRLTANRHAVLQVERNLYDIGGPKVEFPPAVTKPRDHSAGRRCFSHRLHEHWETDGSDCVGDWRHSSWPYDVLSSISRTGGLQTV
ncbi:MAG: hypothetical protein ABI645_12385 [Pseudomonadota bacterium]